MPAVQYAPLGSLSSATMRPEDLIPAFLDALADYASVADTLLTPEQEKTAKFLREIEDRMEQDDYYESEEASWDLDELFTALDAYAAPYCYFGAHEGDGADYGFWISWDSLNDDCRCGDVLKIDAGDEWPEDLNGAEYVLEVTDHGNATLYTPDHAEVWSVV